MGYVLSVTWLSVCHLVVCHLVVCHLVVCHLVVVTWLSSACQGRSCADHAWLFLRLCSFWDGTDLYWARSRVIEYLQQISGRLPRKLAVGLYWMWRKGFDYRQTCSSVRTREGNGRRWMALSSDKTRLRPLR
jgi:hypothetical protein